VVIPPLASGDTTTGQVVTMYRYLVHMVPALPINKLNAVPEPVGPTVDLLPEDLIVLVQLAVLLVASSTSTLSQKFDHSRILPWMDH